MAVAKKAKTPPAKAKGAKASDKNKKTAAKPAKKPAAKPVPSKQSKSSSSKTVAKPAKSVKKPVVPVKSKPAAAKAPAKAVKPAKAAPAVVKKANGKTIPEKAKKPVVASPAKSPEKKAAPAVKTVAAKPAAKNTAPAKPAAKSPAPVKPPVKESAVKSGTENKKPEKAIPAKKEEKGKTAPVKAGGKDAAAKKGAEAKPSDEFPDMDPADAKAKKIMKELEETMDLAAMKPRIKVPTPTKTITTRHVSHPPLRLVEPVNTNKVKYSLEFEFRSSPKILFNALSDSSGLAGWFADEVRTRDDQFTFVWEGGESYARLVAIKDMHLVRFQWNEDTDGTYFQFEIKQDELTNEIALVITDFSLPNEKETSIRLWESQVQNLRMLLGSL